MKSKKIKEEFGLDSEEMAGERYALLNREFMRVNYPLTASQIFWQISPEEEKISQKEILRGSNLSGKIFNQSLIEASFKK